MLAAGAEQNSIWQRGYNQCLAANGWRRELFFTLGWLGGVVKNISLGDVQELSLISVYGALVT